MASLQGTSYRLTCSSRRSTVPFRSSRRPVCTVRAAAEPSAAVPVSSPGSKIVLQWEEDKETPRDVFAFGGSAPERANGRVAMLGFTSLALQELSTHTPALEQAQNAIFSIILVSLTFTFATIIPKLVSGSSLKDLHAAASSDNLKSEGIFGQLLAVFDQGLELWSGRLAMIGVTGLFIVEALKGDALF